MAKYNSDGSINYTSVTGSSLTGLYGADGSVNVVLDDTSFKGLYHPCGAWRVSSSVSGGETFDPSGAYYLDTLLGGVGYTAARRAKLALLKSTANAAVNNNPEFLAVWSGSSPTITYTGSPDAALSTVLLYTNNQDKIAFLGGDPIRNDGTGGTGITVDNWVVRQSNRAPAQGLLTTANGWGANTYDYWAGASNFILTGLQKFELALRQVGGESSTSKVPIRTMVRPVDGSGNPTGPFQYLDKTGIGIFGNNSYYHVDMALATGSYEYRVEHRHCFQALRITGASTTVTKPQTPIKMTWDGDSFSESQTIRFGGAVLGVDHFAMTGICARQLAFYDVQPVAVGLTGYTASAAGARRNLLQRVNDWVGRKPDIHVVMAIYNDGTSAPSLAAADVNMRAYWAAVRAANPTTFMVVAGCPDDSLDTKAGAEAQVAASFATWGDKFAAYIPAYPVVFQRDATDNIHPSGGDAGTGHKTFGDYFAAQILAALNAAVV